MQIFKLSMHMLKSKKGQETGGLSDNIKNIILVLITLAVVLLIYLGAKKFLFGVELP